MSRILAVGDIHGCRRSLESLARCVEFSSDDVIVFLGDYVDRGPDSRGVIDFIMELGKSVPVVTLKGNHEIMMLEAREEDSQTQWLSVGGVETLMSYEARSFDQVPQSHWDFLENLEPYYETETHIFVHANLNPEVALEDQSDAQLYWKRVRGSTRFKKAKLHMSGKTFICGHTAQESGEPLVLEHAICIDTHAHGDGWLTCLDVATGEYWQANEYGDWNIDNIANLES